jgi:hypothetical protein
MRRLANTIEVWRICEERLCRRTRRCAAVENPCFERHQDAFDAFIHAEIIPHLRKQEGDPRYDPDAATETGDGFHAKAPPR